MIHNIKRLILTAVLIATTGVAGISGPVKYTEATYTQPDGSTFSVKVKGDEWSRLRTTSDGCAIVQDEDGWWCYGTYSEDGRISSTGYRADRKAPAEIISDSRRIPYGKLSENAAQKRQALNIRNASQRMKIRSAAAGTPSGETSKRGLAILAQFSDVKFTYTREDFQKLLNQKGYNGTGSVKDYYEDQFGQGWEFTFDVSEIITLPNKLKYYGQNDSYGNDVRPATMAWEACKAADAHIDFSLYDQDRDGEVENVYIFYAGRDESESTSDTDLIWAHQYYIISGDENIHGITKLDGVTIDRYACSSELAGMKSLTGIGTFCHEYGHTLGLPDFYDTDYDENGSWAAGLWNRTSLMDGGNYNNNSATPPNLNCIERNILGLTVPQVLSGGKFYTLEPIHYNSQCYIVNSNTPGEYFLFECRSNEGWDKYIGGQGMLVYHIDENAVEYVRDYGTVNKWIYNSVNADAKHQCADLIEADGRSDEIMNVSRPFNNIKGIFFPQEDVTTLTSDGFSSYRFWDRSKPEVALAGITLSGNTISFSTGNETSLPSIPDIKELTYTSYPDAAYISFKPEVKQNYDKAMVEWNKNGSTDIKSARISPAEDGSFSYLIEGLQSDNTLYEVKVRLEYMGIAGNVMKKQIITKRAPIVIWPYLYLQDGSDINRREGFVAHAVNSYGAVSKEWFLDGEPLPVNSQGKIYPAHSGTLNCVITWEDGSQDAIIKEVKIIN